MERVWFSWSVELEERNKTLFVSRFDDDDDVMLLVATIALDSLTPAPELRLIEGDGTCVVTQKGCAIHNEMGRKSPWAINLFVRQQGRTTN